ncbi:MAG: hypothetical protein IJ261_04755 [Clostridia bacterium]|nr:hypothetical protein [Clostridia bacterium]
MDLFKRIIKLLFFPHIAVVCLLIPVAAGSLVYTFAFSDQQGAIAYASYAISAYTLTIICTKAPEILKKLKRIKEQNKFLKRYTSDAQYRIKLSLYGTFAVNIFYALLQLGSGIYYHSVWNYALAGYYALLAVMRFFLLKETVRIQLGKDMFFEYLHYRLTAVFLLIMNIALAVMVFYITTQNKGFERSPIITIAMAAYSFWAIIMAFVNIKKFSRHTSPITAAAKVISLVAALVSMLSLETSMLSAFGENNDESFRLIITASTGAAVCASVLTLAVYMIVSSTKEIRKLKGEKTDEQ